MFAMAGIGGYLCMGNKVGAKVGGNVLGSDFLCKIFTRFFGKFWSLVVDIPCFWELRVGRVKIVYSMLFF